MNKLIFAAFFIFSISTSHAQVTLTDKDTGVSVEVGLTGNKVKQGEEISKETLNSFVVGTTTYEEVIEKLGKPKSEQSLKGIIVITYNSTQSTTKIDPIKFVPIVGSFFGSTKTEGTHQSISLIFDQEKKLIDIKDMSTSGKGEDKGMIDKLKNLDVKIGK